MPRLPNSPEPDLAPPAEQEGALRRVRSAVLERIAVTQTPLHLTVQADGDGWQPFMDGIELKVLREEGNTLSYFLKLEPGAVLPPHRHTQDEECVVLQGELLIGGTLRIRASDYHLGRAGVLHPAIASCEGALLFLRGAAPDISHLL